MTERDPASVAGIVEYCRTQAGLLAGRAEQLREAADELLDEVDAEVAAIREELGDADGPVAPESPSVADDLDLDALERREGDLAEKQARAEAKQARLSAFQDLAAAYTDLAAELAAAEDLDAATAVQRVVDFEAERDAPAYFTDRLTMVEAAAERSEDEHGASPGK